MLAFPHRVRKGETCSAVLGRGNMPSMIRKGETCPAGFGRGKHALVRLG